MHLKKAQSEMLKIKSFIIMFLICFSFGCSSDNAGGSEVTPPEPPPESGGENPGEGRPPLSDEELLDLVQKETFDYFWDFAESNSGLAKERSQEIPYGGDGPLIVTTGGSGLGMASFPAAVERGWISRTEAINRLDKILDFLESVPKYHGAFSHWYMGNTAQTRPFSTLDDGGDLVETAILLQGLLINRQYFDYDSEDEKSIRDRITTIWENVEWDFYTQGENVLYWHWSPNYNFQIDLQIKGWNESLIVYVLAASSPTHPISKDVYTNGWASNGGIVTNRLHYGFNMPLGPSFGGPLFFSHYSFVGLDPRNLSDQYANYWQQNTAHAKINYEYCVRNPLDYEGYGENTWGLTASDNYEGYSAHRKATHIYFFFYDEVFLDHRIHQFHDHF